jgi:hypothetical protein
MYEENIPVNIQKILLKEYLILIKNTWQYILFMIKLY